LTDKTEHIVESRLTLEIWKDGGQEWIRNPKDGWGSPHKVKKGKVKPLGPRAKSVGKAALAVPPETLLIDLLRGKRGENRD